MVLLSTNKENERGSDSSNANIDAKMDANLGSEAQEIEPAHSDETIVIAVDARPLQHPNSGIGKYTQKILEYLAMQPGVQLKLYGAEPLLAGWAPVLSKILEVLGSWFLYGVFARRDGAHVYWGPRHQLPLLLGRVPAVLTVHDLVWKVFPHTMPRFNYWVERMQMPISVRRASTVVVPSEATGQELAHYLNPPHEKVEVVPLGGDTSAHVAPTAPHPTTADTATPYLLFVGGDHPRKNLPFVLDALAATRAKGLELKVLGPMHHGNAIPQQIENLGLLDRVTVLGEVDEGRVTQLYSNCMALVMPSLHEGFGLPVLEAARCGRPALVAAGNPMATMARGALVVELGQVGGLAEAMDRIATDDELRQRLGDEAWAWAQPLTWAASAQRHLSLCRRLCMMRTG